MIRFGKGTFNRRVERIEAIVRDMHGSQQVNFISGIFDFPQEAAAAGGRRLLGPNINGALRGAPVYIVTGNFPERTDREVRDAVHRFGARKVLGLLLRLQFQSFIDLFRGNQGRSLVDDRRMFTELYPFSVHFNRYRIRRSRSRRDEHNQRHDHG
ncbi:hypothetical protein D1872_271130 [compost metagenome]